MTRPQLIVMRLADMTRVHPEQIVRTCAACGHEVGVYPSGQEVMRQYPDVELICQICREPGHQSALAPGAEFEPFESVKKNPESQS
jgi:hypothetical protein